MAYIYFEGGIRLSEDAFGTFNDNLADRAIPIRRFTWTNKNNVSVQVITYGATITSIKIPDQHGIIDDIVLGFDNLTGYLSPQNRYFGATIGRVANRIANSKIRIGGEDYALNANFGKHQLHGGNVGFDKVVWNHLVVESQLILTYLSKDGEEGFPGDLLVTLTFNLNNDNEFIIDYKAVTTQPTYVNLTNHSYFNLAGHNKGANEIYKHIVSINADRYTEVDESSIPTGKLLHVQDTIFDLRIPTVLGNVIHQKPLVAGYDHNFCISKGTDQVAAFHARVTHPSTSRSLEVYSTQPGVQFYTSNFLPVEGGASKIVGKNSADYNKHGAFCLETQNYPDAIHHSNFPRAVVFPGETFRENTKYKFIINNTIDKNPIPFESDGLF